MSIFNRAGKLKLLNHRTGNAQCLIEEILLSDDVNQQAKQIAANIRPLLNDLREAINTRIDL